MDFKDATSGASRPNPLPNVDSTGSSSSRSARRRRGNAGRQPSRETVSEALSGASRSSPSTSLGAKNLSVISGTSAVEGCAIADADTQAMKQREGHLWECVQRIKVPEGYIYRYRLRDQYDFVSNPDEDNSIRQVVEEMISSIHPAIEKPGITTLPSLGLISPNWKYGEQDVIQMGSKRANDVAKQLGYKLEYTPAGVFAEFPDKEVIDSRWKGIMNRHPEWRLKQLTISSSEQIAGDREFLDAFYEYDTLLSTGREFVHDHQLYVLHTIKFIVDQPKKYLKSKRKCIEIVKAMSRMIHVAREWVKVELKRGNLSAEERAYLVCLEKNLEHGDVIPGIAADTFATFWHSSYTKDFSEDIAKSHLGEALEFLYAGYLSKRFPDPDISIPWLWEEVSKICDKVGKKKK